MSTFSIIAIPFFVMSVVMFALAFSQKHRAFLYSGIAFTTAAVVNTALGLSLA